jgi:hypothetical protein
MLQWKLLVSARGESEWMAARADGSNAARIITMCIRNEEGCDLRSAADAIYSILYTLQQPT